MNKYRYLTICALALLMVVSTGRGGFSAPWDLEELTVSPGFGEVWNRYTYTQVYYEGDPTNDSDDAVYFGTYNQRTSATVDPGDPYDEVNNIDYGRGISFGGTPVSKGGRIWKYHVSTGQWSLVWPNVEDLGNFDTNEFGWRIAEVYLGKVYFGAYKSGTNSGARLMAIDPADDDSVEFIGPGPSNWGSLVSIRALEVYDDKLYIGSEHYLGGDLWSYDGSNIVHVWDRPSDGFYPNVAYLQAYSDVNGDYLYIGGWYNPALYRYNAALPISGTNPANITPGEISGESGGPISMEVFDGKIYIGTANLSGGFSLFYYESNVDVTPTFIEHSSFDDMTYAWILKACGDRLFMGAFTSGGNRDEGLWVTPGNDPAGPGCENGWCPMPGFYPHDPEEYGVRSMACGIPVYTVNPAEAIPHLFYGTAAVNTGSSALRFSHATRIFRIEGPFDDPIPALPPE